MFQTIDAIFEGGVFKPLSDLRLPEKQRVRLIVESTSDAAPVGELSDDPLADLRCDMGIADFAENFDDYRFGRREP